MPVAYYYRDWKQIIYGLKGTVTFTLKATPHPIGPGMMQGVLGGQSSNMISDFTWAC